MTSCRPRATLDRTCPGATPGPTSARTGVRPIEPTTSPPETGEAARAATGRALLARALRRRWLLAAALGLPAAVALASWWLTEPLDDSARPTLPPAESSTVAAPAVPSTPARPAWPSGRLEGAGAKALLLTILEDDARRIDATAGYTATFRKQERVDGRLLPEQTLAMKIRHRPFAVYLKFLAPKPGKEVIYAEGHHGNKVVAHSGDWTRRLVPRLAVDPDGPIALADNRHPITEAGLSNLVRKLLHFRRLDLEDPEALTILDVAPGPDGRPWPRSIHLHDRPAPTRPFTRIEVFYDPESLLPLRISSYDWPPPGQSGEPPLAERYCYEGLRLDAPLGPIDFDLANPDYGFQR